MQFLSHYCPTIKVLYGDWDKIIQVLGTSEWLRDSESEVTLGLKELMVEHNTAGRGGLIGRRLGQPDRKSPPAHRWERTCKTRWTNRWAARHSTHWPNGFLDVLGYHFFWGWARMKPKAVLSWSLPCSSWIMLEKLKYAKIFEIFGKICQKYAERWHICAQFNLPMTNESKSLIPAYSHL